MYMRKLYTESNLNPLPDGPRSDRPYDFQRLTALSIMVLKICKKYVSLGFYLEKVLKSLYWLNKA